MKGKSWAPWLLAGMLVLGSVQATAAPEGAHALTREAAQKEVRALQAVQVASRRARDAYEEWQNSMRRANDIDTEKQNFENPFTGKTITIRFNDKTQLRLRMQKYLQPDQLKFSWQMATKSFDLTISSLENTMDSLLLGLYASQNDLKAKARSLKLSTEALARAKASWTAGKVTQLDVDAAALDLEKADKALKASQRAFENQCRNYNRFAGAPLSRRLSVSPDLNSTILYLSTDAYVAEALQNRTTLFSLREGNLLKERNLEMLTFRDLHKLDPDIASEYARAKLDLDKARLDLTAELRSVTAEIRSAVLVLASAQLDLKVAQLSLQRQKTKLETMKKQMAAGRIPDWSDDALVSAIAGLEEGLAVSRLSMAGKVVRFRQAVRIGPEFAAY